MSHLLGVVVVLPGGLPGRAWDKPGARVSVDVRCGTTCEVESRKGGEMYIGGGLLTLIVIILLLVWLL
jgi:hypothetical protein